MAGIGKTALAVHWAHEVADRFPDGQLFVNLRGSGPTGAPVAPTDAVRGFLTALGVPPARIPLDPDWQAALYRSLLADRRMLIVLDNAQDAEQVRPLLPGSPGCLVLVTSRNRLVGLAARERAHLITLGVLTTAESQALLASQLGTARAAAEPRAVSELAALCGCLPLALRDAAARALARPDLPLFRARDRDARHAKTTGRVGDRRAGHQRQDGVLLVASTAWDLSVTHVPAARGSSRSRYHGSGSGESSRAVTRAGVPGTGGVVRRAPAHGACSRPLHLSRSAAHLRGGGGVHTRERGRPQRRGHRALDHYLHAGIMAARFLYPCETEVTWPSPRPGVTLNKIGGPGQAADWFEDEQHVLFAMIRQAADGGYAPYAWQLPWITAWYFQGEACWQRLAIAQESALAVAASVGDITGLVMARVHLGWLRFLLGDVVSAGHHLDDASELARKLEDGQLRVLAGLSRGFFLQSGDRIQEMVASSRQARSLIQLAGISSRSATSSKRRTSAAVRSRFTVNLGDAPYNQ